MRKEHVQHVEDAEGLRLALHECYRVDVHAVFHWCELEELLEHCLRVEGALDLDHEV